MTSSKLLIAEAANFIVSSNEWATRSMLFLWSSLVILAPTQQFDMTAISALCERAQLSLQRFGSEGSAAATFLACAMRRPGCDSLNERIFTWASNCSNYDQDGIILLLIRFLKSGSECGKWKSALLSIYQRSNSKSVSAHSRRLHLRFHTYLSLAFPNEMSIFHSTINLLLESLADRDTRIRWAAAKGIRRLATLLPTPSINDLINGLIQRAEPSADLRHGICLALGQLFMSKEIDDESTQHCLTDFTRDCLIFEVNKGTFALGSNVRDAASYVCWSLFRHQKWATKSQSAIINLAQTLLAISVMDREISCRRAGAAALQELVGRASCNVPHGLDILEQVNFFTISSLAKSFGEILPHLLQMQAYRAALLHHLITITCRSFDKNMRELAARALGPLDLDSTFVERLLAYATSENDPSLVHVGLVSLAYRLDSGNLIQNEGLERNLTNFSNLPNSRSPGYQLSAEAWLVFLRSLIKSQGITIMSMDSVYSVLKNALRSRFVELHSGPCFLLLETVSDAAPVDDPELTGFYRTVALPAADKDFDPNAQKGFSAVLGAMPTWLIRQRLVPLSNLLLRLANAKEPINDIDKRVLIVRSIGHIFYRPELELPADLLDHVMDCLIQQTTDYSIDSRGDVGSFIREEALRALSSLFPIMNPVQIEKFLGKLLHQAFDRLDRIRGLARTLLTKHPWPVHVPCETLQNEIGAGGLLYDLRFQTDILTGWINSAGSPTPSVATPAWDALKAHFDQVLPAIIKSDSWWHPDHRLFRPLIATLFKWSDDLESKRSMELIEGVAKVLVQNLKREKCPIQSQIEAIRLLKYLPCEDSHLFIQHLSCSSPYPRIRQLCSE